MSGRYFILALLLLYFPLRAPADTLVVADHAQALTAPFVRQGEELLAPLLPSLPLLGATAVLNGNAVTLTSADSQTLKLKVGSLTAVSDDSIFTLDAAPCLVNGELYLPVHSLATWLGMAVRFQPESGTLTLSPLISVTSEPRDGGLAILVRCKAPLQYTSGRAVDPPRAYFDFKHVAVSKPEPQFEIGKNGVGRVRLSQNSIAPDIARLVIDFTAEKTLTPTIDEHGRLVALLLDLPHAPTVPATPIAGPPGPLAGPPPPVTEQQTAITLTGITLTKQTAKQSELLVTTDGPVALENSYDATTRQITLRLPNTVNGMEHLTKLADATVEKVEVQRDDPTQPGLSVRVTLHKGASYLLNQDTDGIHLLTGAFSLGDMVVTLDAGHGGHDTGAIGCNRTLEKVINLDVILRVGKLLAADGAKVLLTRKDDTFIPLDDRPALANNNNADLFVSVHCNSTPVRNSCSGTQVYYRTPQSIPLAGTMHEEVMKGTGLKDGGIRTANYLVLRKSRMPAILIEIAFINNDKEECLLCDAEYLQKVAVSIANGIRRYAATKAFRLWHAADHAISAKPPTPAETPPTTERPLAGPVKPAGHVSTLASTAPPEN